MILNVEVKERIATYKPSGEKFVCGNSGDQVKFIFDDEWEAHDKKTARFIWNNKYFDQEFTGDTCDIPVITNATAFLVGVYVGETADNEPIISTTRAVIPTTLSIRCGSETANRGTGENYTNEAKGYAEEAKGYAAESKAAITNIHVTNETLNIS